MNTQDEICKVCDEIKALLLEKNLKYGDSALNPQRVFSRASSVEQLNVRIDDKLSRIKESGTISVDEDTLQDLIGYLVLLRIATSQRKGLVPFATTYEDLLEDRILSAMADDDFVDNYSWDYGWTPDDDIETPWDTLSPNEKRPGEGLIFGKYKSPWDPGSSPAESLVEDSEASEAINLKPLSNYGENEIVSIITKGESVIGIKKDGSTFLLN